MMFDWNEYRAADSRPNPRNRTADPDTLRGYGGLSGAGAKAGKLDAKTRESIALAVAVTRHCDGCITIHTDAAIKRGATREVVAGGTRHAIVVNAGAALVYSGRVMDAYANEIMPAG